MSMLQGHISKPLTVSGFASGIHLVGNWLVSFFLKFNVTNTPCFFCEINLGAIFNFLGVDFLMCFVAEPN